MSSGIFDPNVELPKICDKVEAPAMPEAVTPKAPTLPDMALSPAARAMRIPSLSAAELAFIAKIVPLGILNGKW